MRAPHILFHFINISIYLPQEALNRVGRRLLLSKKLAAPSKPNPRSSLRSRPASRQGCSAAALQRVIPAMVCFGKPTRAHFTVSRFAQCSQTYFLYITLQSRMNTKHNSPIYDECQTQ